MNKPVFGQVLQFLEEVPPSIAHSNCELCGGTWLVRISNVDRYGLPGRFVMCRQCGLVTQNPRWDYEAYGRFYTDFYRPLVTEWRGYPSTATSGDSALDWLQKMAQATGLEQALPSSPRVMDIGGGTGVLAEFIRDAYGGEVTIVEPNAREAEEAVAKGFEVVVDVFENAAFEPDSFDLIIMIRTVDHLIDANETFTKIRQALKPGGYFLADGADYFRRMAFQQSAVTPLKIDHCYYFSPETLPLMLRKNGLHAVICDVTVLPGEIVNLARAGEPEDVSVSGLEVLSGAQHRYFEWERLADRPGFVPTPGYVVRSISGDLAWLKSKVGQKLKRR